MSKIVTLAAAGGAYVLGARAGTERYEQISQQAKKLWRDPRVQEKTSRASHLVKKKADKMTGSGEVACGDEGTGGEDEHQSTSSSPTPRSGASQGAKKGDDHSKTSPSTPSVSTPPTPSKAAPR